MLSDYQTEISPNAFPLRALLWKMWYESSRERPILGAHALLKKAEFRDTNAKPLCILIFLLQRFTAVDK